MKKGILIGLGVIVLIVIVLLLMTVGSYNGLVTKQQNVNAQWALVQTQMQRRADLIPNIVSTVKGIDRKSTRLNSSHSQISYAVFCLKKKKTPTSFPDTSPYTLAA